MKRWEVVYDGAPGGHVYAESVDEARAAAQAAYGRVHPDRDPRGRVRVRGEGEAVRSEAGEAQRIVAEVYEGLRLLPGMELPAEKLRSALVLLESAVARESLGGSVGPATRRAGGSDSELQRALRPVFESACVPTPVKERLRGLLDWVGLKTEGKELRKIELKAFETLWNAGLVDYRFEERPSCRLHQPAAFLVRRLTRAKVLRVERFEGCRTVDDFRAALAPHGAEAAASAWSFVPEGGGAAEASVLRPLVLWGPGKVLQRARILRGVPVADDEVVAFDRALCDAWERLKDWTDGLGLLAEPHLKEKQLSLFERAEKRIRTARDAMAAAAREGREVLPPDTARRDLVKFLIDQVHRIEDALAFLPDRSLRDAFGELVFKDVVFRGAGSYLSMRFGIHIDTAVVEGADAQALVGRYRKEPGGPRPKAKSSKIHTVVVPCYTQDGTTVRPASVRLGVY
ncbi:MAG: hypothetical protein D6731_05965 [Planctomycetota bacterium]|nr:MAG: hypothetical protein D6731_05965 [Planctomycetota bacterium]